MDGGNQRGNDDGVSSKNFLNSEFFELSRTYNPASIWLAPFVHDIYRSDTWLDRIPLFVVERC